MIIQAELRRKQSEYEGESCAVDKVIELPSQRFQQFSRALLADYDFIAENKNAVRHDGDTRHCLLILDAEGKDGFLVDPQGHNYARYSAFVPNARSLLTPDIGNTEYETVRLRRLLTGRKPITEPDAELLQSTVSKVRVTNNCVTVTLKNGQAIERRDQL